jgi:hypothetical protein
LLDQFVCVRLVRMNRVDLNQFQFDYDQTWSVMFLRPDGAVIARYGSRTESDAMSLNSMDGLKLTMLRVLEADEQWPVVKQHYADKRGPLAKFERPEKIPSETIAKIKGREGNGGCIHCHNVYDAHRDYAISKGNYDPYERWKYPLPRNIGIEVDPVLGTEISAVIPGSAAEDAGFCVGSEVFAVEGQRVHSLADIQFALHHAQEQAQLEVTTKSEQVLKTHSVTLAPGWRRVEIGWRASMYGMPPKPRLWVQSATTEEKRKLNIANDRLALKVRGAFGKEVARELKKGDVIVQFGDRSDHHTEGQFHAAVRLNYFRPDSVLPLTVIRGDKQLEVRVHFANQ